MKATVVPSTLTDKSIVYAAHIVDGDILIIIDAMSEADARHIADAITEGASSISTRCL